MTVPRLFHAPLSTGRATLSRDESHHAGSVLRCRAGDRVVLFDGDGREAEAVVSGVSRERVGVDIGVVVERPEHSRFRLTLACALPRKQRQPYLFEKCTELGVWGVWPTIYERSVVKPEKDQLDKWRRTTIEAAKQCGRARLPVIEPPMSFDDTIGRAAAFDRCLVTGFDTTFAPIGRTLTMCDGDRTRSGCSTISSANSPRLFVWIGPEGGMTPDETTAALAAGAVGTTLGDPILRIETAAAAVCALALCHCS